MRLGLLLSLSCEMRRKEICAYGERKVRNARLAARGYKEAFKAMLHSFSKDIMVSTNFRTPTSTLPFYPFQPRPQS